MTTVTYSSTGTAVLEDPSIVQPIQNKIPAEVDVEALRVKYLEEREKRLNNGGIEQYRFIEGSLEKWLKDPWVRPGYKREPVHIECDALIIGAGYAGQLMAVRLLQQGIENIWLVEKGGDFGGTWYWNRFPGAQCDVESYIYMPLLEEMNYIPMNKYSYSDELLEHSKAIGRHWDLYRRALFQTEVNGLHWDEPTATWRAETNWNDDIRARFVLPVAGPLHRPKMPGLKGIETYKGESFHSSRWNYAYTGGDPTGGLTGLKDKRVGIIGTGATSVQVIPHLGKWAKELYVFQRTPSSVDVRGNKATSVEFKKSLKAGWQRERMDNFVAIVNGDQTQEDMVADGWTSACRRLFVSQNDDKQESAPKIEAQRQAADFQRQETIRKRVDREVRDPVTAAALKPWYNTFCKRPCFHDEYLQTFNLSNVHLVDTNGRGVGEITTKGVIANGQEYELDCIIYATGYELTSDWTHRSGIEIYGRGGQVLTEKWRDGVATLHGWTTRGFPNCFFISLNQAGQAPNYIHFAEAQSKHIAWVVAECRKRNLRTLEPTAEAEEAWVQEILAKGEARVKFHMECTPGYFNNEGNINLRDRKNTEWGAGLLAYLDLTRKWREDGKLEGMEAKPI